MIANTANYGICPRCDSDEEPNIDPLILRKNKVQEICYLGNQPHILHFFKDISQEDGLRLMDELENMPFRDLNLSFKLCYSFASSEAKWKYSPPQQLEWTNSDPFADSGKSLPPCSMAKLSGVSDKIKMEWYEKGLETIARGKVAVVLLAGGQASRFGQEQPKGTFQIGPVSCKSLIQLFAERLVTVRNLAGDAPGGARAFPVQLYVMTSEENDAQTRKYFDSLETGLEKTEIHFFKQKMIPTFNKKGKVLLSDPSHIVRNPNGNGGVFDSLVDSGMFKQMKRDGVEGIHVIGIDNALCKIADPTFIGFAVLSGAEVVNKCVEKTDPEESIGVFCRREPLKENDGSWGSAVKARTAPHSCVVEYSEISDEMKRSRVGGENGPLEFSGGNICSHYFTLDFIRRLVSSKFLNSKYHAALRRVKCIDMENMDDHFPILHPKPTFPTSDNAVKLELFVFDSFEYSSKVVALQVSRDSEFAPIKNQEGPSSPDSAIALVSRLHQRWLKDAGFTFDPADVVAGSDKDKRCEVSPLISYDSENLTSHVRHAPVSLPFHLA